MWPWQVCNYHTKVTSLKAVSILQKTQKHSLLGYFKLSQKLLQEEHSSQFRLLEARYLCRCMWSGLTDSGRWCVPLHTPSASCEPEPEGWGRLSWSRAHHGTGTSAGTGSDAPRAGLPEAAEQRQHGEELFYCICITPITYASQSTNSLKYLSGY